MIKLFVTIGSQVPNAFFIITQAVEETLPIENKEKKLLEGSLNMRENIIQD